MCVCLHLSVIQPERGGSCIPTCCQGYVTIIFTWLLLYLRVAVIDLQKSDFSSFCGLVLLSASISLPSKFNLTCIKRLTPSPFVAEGNQFKVIELSVRVCECAGLNSFRFSVFSSACRPVCTAC